MHSTVSCLAILFFFFQDVVPLWMHLTHFLLGCRNELFKHGICKIQLELEAAFKKIKWACAQGTAGDYAVVGFNQELLAL